MDGQVADDEVREMVAALRPAWTVRGVDRCEYGTDFVAFLDVRAPDGDREAVLKATTADFVDPEIARAEPRLLELVGRETTVPVPAVYGYRDDHPDHPSPFYLMERVDGENFENRVDDLPTAARERVVGEAGRNLAALHDLGPLPAAGNVGVEDGDLAVLDTDDHPRADDFHAWLLEGREETLDELLDGGWFPEKADDRERFADLVPDLRAYCRETLPALPDPAPPTYCHWDYRYGNLLVDPETGETRAVLDWANLTAAPPAYNLAKVESHLFDPVTEDDDVVAALREQFRTAYADACEGWAFEESVRERMAVYRLTSRVDAMACLPLWHEEATPAERDRIEDHHRTFLADYLED